MHDRDRHCLLRIAIALWICSLSVQAQNAPLTNTVTATTITAYTVNGQSNPSFTLLRGVTYVFQVNVTIHPFYIKTNFTALGPTDEYTNGVTGSGVTTGNLIFTVPANAPNLLYYHCGTHAPMGGSLTIVSPPSPARKACGMRVAAGRATT